MANGGGGGGVLSHVQIWQIACIRVHYASPPPPSPPPPPSLPPPTPRASSPPPPVAKRMEKIGRDERRRARHVRVPYFNYKHNWGLHWLAVG